MDRPEARRRISEYWIKKRCRGKTVLEVLKEIRLESEQELAFFLYALLDDEHRLDVGFFLVQWSLKVNHASLETCYKVAGKSQVSCFLRNNKLLISSFANGLSTATF